MSVMAQMAILLNICHRKHYDKLTLSFLSVIVIEMFHIDRLSYWNSSMSLHSVQRLPVLPCALINTSYSVDPSRSP